MMIQIAAPARKHVALLVAIVVTMVIQPLAGHRSVQAGMVFDAVFAMICLCVFLIVFGERRERLRRSGGTAPNRSDRRRMPGET